MRKHVFLALLLVGVAAARPSVVVDPAEAAAAGKRIWQNECSGTVDGLTSWNKGEEFPSLGIGHFIWYPQGYRGPFEESFPGLIEFLKARNCPPPAWLEGLKGCPWASREQFLADYHGEKLRSLRLYLKDTVPQQTLYITERMQSALPRMLEACPKDQRERVEKRFHQVLSSPGGVYPLIDYVNFKGEGIKETERYKGQGWGLLQVLQLMDPGKPPLQAFSQAAEAVLERRVRNSPPERGEQRWMQGWRNRVRGYLSP